jgi:2-hydroxychromene-2-carboxylate isomerase
VAEKLPAPTPLRFLFDYVSPYAYLAWTQVHALAKRHGREVEPVPVLFAGLLNAHGHKGPAEIPPKRAYIYKDVLRTARALGVPLVMPAGHPFNSLLALRASSLDMDAATRTKLVDGLFRAAWAGGAGIDRPEAVARAATEAGLDGAAVVDAAGSPAVKAKLRAQTDAALAEGVFGVPTVIVDGELFWGFDAFAHIERMLRGEDPITADELAKLKDLPVSASRI